MEATGGRVESRSFPYRKGRSWPISAGVESDSFLKLAHMSDTIPRVSSSPRNPSLHHLCLVVSSLQKRRSHAFPFCAQILRLQESWHVARCESSSLSLMRLNLLCITRTCNPYSTSDTFEPTSACHCRISVAPSKESIDEWRQSRSLRKNKEQPNKQQHNNDRTQPPFLSDLHILPELTNYSQLPC
jgi:hypothetical protein